MGAEAQVGIAFDVDMCLIPLAYQSDYLGQADLMCDETIQAPTSIELLST